MDDRMKELVNKFNSAPPVSSQDKNKPAAKTAKTTVKSSLKQSLKGTNAGVTKSTKATDAAASSAPGANKAAAKAGPTIKLSGAGVAMGTKVKAVLDCLQAADQPLTLEEIKAKTTCDLLADKNLYQRISTNEKVLVMGNMLKYKPTHNIYDKASLLHFIREHRLGTLVDSIKDCYKAINEDLKVLVNERKILYMAHPDPLQESVFPVDMMDVDVDEVVNSMYHEVALPMNVQDLQAMVKEAGLKSQLEKVPLSKRPVQTQKDKKRHRAERAVDINKATNKHLPMLFMGAQPKNIDEK